MFIELAIVLVIVGVMTWAASSGFENSSNLRDRERAMKLGEVLRESVRAFTLLNARLPCPDTSGSGWEGDASGICASNAESGWFPYRSLGLDRPDTRYLAAYAVYRRTSAVAESDADTVVRKERTGDAAGTARYQDGYDLLKALNNAQTDALSQSRTRLTGNDSTEGVIDCLTNVRSNPAFFLVLPLGTRGTNTNPFEVPHGIDSNCAWASGTAYSQTRDDVVIAESLSTLSGWLSVRTR